MQHLFAPHLDFLIGRAKNQPAVIGEDNRAALLRLFSKLQAIEACGEDERRELWLSAERGSIEDFGDYEEYLDEGEVESYEEFETLWHDYYPEPVKWYPLTTVVYRDYYSVFLDQKLVLQIAPDEENKYEYDKSELIAWLSARADDCIASLKAGTYNDRIAQSLPARKRVGKILREDYWRIFPEEKAAYLQHITPEEIRSFTAMMQSHLPGTPSARLPEMTAGLFFDYCRLGYEANNYEGAKHLSPRELYLAHADGRHDGLLDLPEDSAEAFADWKKNGKKGGHPWEVCRGGNSTHISLYARRDDNGWWLELAGSSHGRSVETIKFYLALVNHGLPVLLHDGPALAAMITGQDYIGIVPEGIVPRYCHSWFPKNEKFLEYMNLPWENAEAVAQLAEWYPLMEVKLTQPEMTAEAAVSILKLLEQNGIEVYVDGGWGVDALLGEQTRRHEDLDIAVPHKYVPQLRMLLAARGYEEVPRPDSWECNFVLGDTQGHLVDVHSYTFDETGKNIFGVAYKPHHLTGTGTINGYPVKCPPPDVMVEFHTGYDVDEDDYRDVKALCERFDIPLPEEYAKFEKPD